MAVRRRTPDGQPPDGWHAEQAISLEDALAGVTAWPAYAGFDEHRVGTLAPGRLADLVILTTDIFALPQDRLLDASVAVTIFDGRVVYER